MRSQFKSVDLWDAASLYFRFNSMNCTQGFPGLPFLGEKKVYSDTPRLLSCFKKVITAREKIKFVLSCSFHSDAKLSHFLYRHGKVESIMPREFLIMSKHINHLRL